MIGAESLSLSYGDLPVVKDVEFELQPGSLTALIGANGSGKSTLMRGLAGLHEASDGRVTGPAQLPILKRRDALAYLPQGLPDPSALSVEEFALLGADAPNRWSVSQQARQRVDQALKTLDLSSLAQRACSTLSGGEYRRAGLAACLAQGAPWLLLDEPCAGLDLPHAAALLAGLRQWLADDGARGALVVLHDLNLAAQWADRCLLMCNGELLADDDPETVLTSDALESAFGANLQRFRHPQHDHLVILGPRR